MAAAFDLIEDRTKHEEGIGNLLGPTKNTPLLLLLGMDHEDNDQRVASFTHSVDTEL
jgi:hypothetical protein